MTALRRLFPLFGCLALVSAAACGEDAAAPAPVASAGAGGSVGGAGPGAAGASGTSAGGAKAGTGGAAGSQAGTSGAGQAGSSVGGSAGTSAGTTSGGAGGQLAEGACKVDADCPKTTTTFPADCAEGYCGTDQKCRFRAKDDDGDSHRKKTCQSLAGAVIELGQDCNDADKDTHPGAWDGPADGPLPNRCNDSVDQDCSGIADDGVATTGATCVCVPADTRPCSEDANGNPITWPKLDAGGLPVGECKRGSQICTPQGKWGVCTGVKAPLKELCDDKDNDCDGEVDEGPPTDAPYWLYDGDKDLHAPEGSEPVQACDAPKTSPKECASCPGVDAAGTSLWRTNIPDDDCNDADNSIKPGQAETCNGDGVDHNCDGLVNVPGPEPEKCKCTNGDVVDCAREGEIYPGAEPSDAYPLTAGPALLGICSWGKKQCVAGQWGVCNGGKGRDAVEEQCLPDGLDHNCNGQTNAQECVCTAGMTKKCGNCNLGTSTCVGTTSPQWGDCDFTGDPRAEYCEDKDNDGVCGPCAANVCPVDVAGRKLETTCFKTGAGRALDCDDNPATGAIYGAAAKGACKYCVPGSGPSASLQAEDAPAPAPNGIWDWNCNGTTDYDEQKVIRPVLAANPTERLNGSATHDKQLVTDYCAQFASQGACNTGRVVFSSVTLENLGEDDICGHPAVVGECFWQPAQTKCTAPDLKDYDDARCR